MINSILLKERSYIFKAEVVCDSSNDPLSLNRVQVWIPQIHGGEIFDKNKVGREGSYPWASCIVMNNSLPPVGSKVAVGFEGNDYNFPIIFGIYSSDREHLGNSSGQGGIESQYAGGSLAEIAAKIIFSNEGSYDSIAWNDHNCLANPKNFTASCTCANSKSGSISIGKIQWHANRARNLLMKIRDKNPTKFNEICNKYNAGELMSLLSESTSWGSMRNWSSECPIGKAIKEILGTDESKQAQDEQAIADVQNYIDTAKKGGITDPACLIYLADIINQYGSCPGLVNSGINNLDELYKYSLSNGYGAYEPRRTSTYNKIKEVEARGDLTPSQLSDISGNTGNGQLGWPAPGISSVTSYFGTRSLGYHPGIDIGCPVGTKLYASHDGILHKKICYGSNKYGPTVYVNGQGTGSLGCMVTIDGGDVGFSTLYGHMQDLSPVPDGAQVKRGQFIGYSGNTGNSTGPHLHFGVYKRSTYTGYSSAGEVNPLDYLQRP